MNVARGVRDLSIPLESSGVTHLKLEIMCDVTGYIYVTQKKKKKPTSTGERNQTKKKKKRSKKCQKAKPKSRFYKPTNHGEEYKYYNCLVTRKASYPTVIAHYFIVIIIVKN